MAKLPRGVNLSGLEFGSAIPGTQSIDYFKPQVADVDYYAAKGLSVLRIPFKWERVQPTLGGALNTTELGFLDAAIAEARAKNIQVIIEPHNYGRFYIQQAGGFTSDFSSVPDTLWNGGNQTAGHLFVNNFQRATAGSITNPLTPADSYKVTADIRVDAINGADTWRALWLEFYRIDDNNKYFFTINTQTGTWELFKAVAGVQTLLSSGLMTFNIGTYYTIELDINQATPGKVNLKINTVQKANVNSDAALTHGQVALFSNGVNGSITNVTVDVDGDTTAGRTSSGNYIIGAGDGFVTLANFANLWSRLATYYLNEPTILAFDLMNEPYTMPVPTTPTSYNHVTAGSRATVTRMNQAAIDAIRATGDTHWIMAPTDNFSGFQDFTNQFGTNPTWWYTDALNKVGLSMHYYFDSDHSGIYSGPYSATYLNRIDTEILPALQWCYNHNIQVFAGEYGVPAQSVWYPALDQFLQRLDFYNSWGTYWAGGQQYTSITSIQPSSSYGVDSGQMPTVQAHLPDERASFVKPAVDVTTQGKTTGGTLTITHPIFNVPERVLVVSVSAFSSIPTQRPTTSVTCDGVALTKQVESDSYLTQPTLSSSGRSEMWYLVNPAVNAMASIVVNGTSPKMATVRTVKSVNQLTPIDSFASNYGGTNISVVNLTTNADNCLLLDVIASDPVPTRDASQTQDGNNLQLQIYQNHAVSEKLVPLGATPSNMKWSLNYGSEWRSCAIALKPAPPHPNQFISMRASVVNTSKILQMRAHVSGKVGKTIQVKARTFPSTAGSMSTIPYRSIDVMKWTKDLVVGQPSDTLKDSIVNALSQYFNLTHIALVFPIDPTDWYPTGFVPGPDTVVGCYQKWVDKIRAKGRNILHRPVSFGMEHTSGFLWRVGANRYPLGVKAEIIPTTFTDTFNRAQIPTSVVTSTNSFQDTFTRTTIGTTDWQTPVGNWSIQGNELVCANVSNATGNVILAKQSVTDFTLTAKIKKVSGGGFSGVAFRMKQDTAFTWRAYSNYFAGYVLELRGTNSFRVEDIATANLAESTAKAFVPGSYYQVKITVSGSNIKAKVWDDGTVEPGAWALDFNDTRYADGYVGFVPENTTLQAVFDDLYITFNPITSTVSDWTAVGNWSTEANTAKVGNVANAAATLLLSKVTYTNFTITAKVKVPTSGWTGVVFRMNKTNQFPGYSGYVAELRADRFIIEDLALSTIASDTTVAFTPGSWYQVKIVCNGGHIQARVWLDGASEPTTYNLDFTNTKYSTGSFGFTAENTGTPAYFDDAAITIAANYNSFLGIMYNFIVNNPTLFSNYDIWAPFPERTENIFNDATSFVPSTAPGLQANYANFFNDVKYVADYAFSIIGKNVTTGWTSNNFSEVRSGWIPPSVFDTAGVTAFDYYQNYNGNGFAGATLLSDLNAVYAQRGHPIVYQEWGALPDLISATGTQDHNVREATLIRPVYDAIATAGAAGKLIMFNYWGFWDTGDTDSGLAYVSGTTIKLRQEGYILAEYFSAGAHPQHTLSLKARTKKAATKTITMKARAVTTPQKSISMRAHAIVRHGTDKTVWTPVPDIHGRWDGVIH